MLVPLLKVRMNVVMLFALLIVAAPDAVEHKPELTDLLLSGDTVGFERRRFGVC